MADISYLLQRKRVLINTDPQKRCYNGAYFSCKWEWGPWEILEIFPQKETKSDRLDFWRDLNNFAVSQRGKEAEKQFKIVNEDDYSWQSHSL